MFDTLGLNRKLSIALLGPTRFASGCGGDGGGGPLEVVVSVDEPTRRVHVTVSGALGADDVLQVRTRRGHVGTLDCASIAGDLVRVDPTTTVPTNPESPYEALKMGFFAAGAHLYQFRALFQEAFPESWRAEFSRFKRRIGMPKGNHPKMSQREGDALTTMLKTELGYFDAADGR